MNTSLRNDGESTTCASGVCGRQSQPVGRQRFYDAACRQKAWRRRHPPRLPAIPARVPRVATVYVCTECDTRYLGEQRCTECLRCCTRVGTGVPGPPRGVPLASADLI